MKTEDKTEQFLFKIDVKYLFAICKNLKDLITEVRFNLDKNGLKIVEIEPANICLIDVVLNKGLFQQLEIEDNKTFGLNVDNLYNILKEQKKQDVKVYQNNIGSADKLIFSFSNGFKSELCLIDIETDKKNIPIMEHKTEVTLKSKRFKEIIKNCVNVADALIIEKKDDDVFFIAEGLNRTEIKLQPDEVRATGENSKSKYSLEYLNKFIKELISENVTLKFNNDYPLIVEYNIPYFKINYLLAPRIGED